MKAVSYLAGKLLIAMPGMSDARFDRSLILLCVHSETGAMGLIINKVMPMMKFSDLAAQLEMEVEAGQPEPAEEMWNMPVQYGGPVEPSRGFVLHSTDFMSADSSLPVSEKFALTATLDILKAMARNAGPRRSLLALGYSGWAPGQLEDEIQRNGWLHCDPDEHLLFGAPNEEKYMLALKKLGVDPAMLSSDAGHG